MKNRSCTLGGRTELFEGGWGKGSGAEDGLGRRRLTRIKTARIYLLDSVLEGRVMSKKRTGGQILPTGPHVSRSEQKEPSRVGGGNHKTTSREKKNIGDHYKAVLVEIT